MPRMRFLRVGLLVALALAAAGCGTKKQSGSVPAGSEFAPASAPVYIALATDPNGAQWKAADRLLSKFPGRDKLLADARKELKRQNLNWETDIKPALPNAIHVVWIDFANNGDDVVGYAKPKDEAKFNRLLDAGKPGDKQVHKKIDGWTVFSDKQTAIDRFERARASGDSLSDVKAFRDAISELPEDAVARGWVSGQAVQAEIDRQAGQNSGAQSFKDFAKTFGTLESVSFSATAEDQGVKVEAAYKATKDLKVGSFSAKLDDALPAGALVYVSFGSLQDYLNQALQAADESSPDFQKQRAQFEQALAFSLKEDLFPLFSQEGAVAVYRGGELIPNVLFVLRVPDESKAQRIIDRLAAVAALGGSDSRTVTVHGVAAKEFSIPNAGASILAAVADGKAFVTNSKADLDHALGDAKKLADDAIYQKSRSVSGAPDETTGFLYANLQAGLPYIFDFAESSDPSAITPDVRANTKPLDSVFLFGRKDGNRVSVSGFLTIK
jgi:uncharacterized protein DUF3352